MPKKLTKDSSITLVEINPTQFGILNGEPNFDEYSISTLPSRALPTLEGILRQDGWRDVQSINPVIHGKNKRLTKDNLKRIYSSDFLLISSITRTSPQSMKLVELYKLKNPRGLAIAGGSDPTFRAEDWLNYVDVVVRKEGEKTLPILMNRLIEDLKNLDDIEGIAFKKKGNEIIITPERKFLTSEELSNLPHPYYDEKTIKRAGVGVIETSRGCPNNCDFCGVTKFYGGEYRKKSVDYIIEELRRVKKSWKILFYVDDNFVGNSNSSMEKSLETLEAIANNGLIVKRAAAQVTIRAAKNNDLLKALKKAGIMKLCIGIESINDKTLKAFGKPYNSEQNKEAIKKLKDYGFWIHGMLMPGGDGDTIEYLEELSHWANNNLDSVQYFPPGPLPGTSLTEQMEKEGRILTKNYSLYDGHSVVIRPKNENLKPYELQEMINKMYHDFYSWKNSLKRLRKSVDKFSTIKLLLYTHMYKGIKKVLESPQARAHLEFLKSVS